MRHYRGWNYDQSGNRPVTGVWRATRHGVGMSAPTEEQLRRMIDARVIAERETLAQLPQHAYVVQVETSLNHSPWRIESMTEYAPHAEAAQELAIVEIEARGTGWAHRYVISIARRPVDYDDVAVNYDRNSTPDGP